MRSNMSENVAEHSYHVALLTHMLCMIGNIYCERELNAERAVTLALFHDASEVFTGDIATPVKYDNPLLLASFREMERIAGERLLSMTPTKLQPTYARLLLNPDPLDIQEQELHKYVKAADRLDAYLKSTLEVAIGNREFEVARKQTYHKLQQLKMPEIDYFLEHIAPSFEMSLDELSHLQS